MNGSLNNDFFEILVDFILKHEIWQWYFGFERKANFRVSNFRTISNKIVKKSIISKGNESKNCLKPQIHRNEEKINYKNKYIIFNWS